MSHLLQMRGLKLKGSNKRKRNSCVASFTDAWIETTLATRTAAILKSHLLQMRGLKRTHEHKPQPIFQSHLLQMRGLKLFVWIGNIIGMKSHLLQMRGLKPLTVSNINLGNVASFTDAWIET